MLIRPDSWNVTTAPAAEPISTAEAKAHLRVDTTDDDALIAALIIAARQYVEKVTSRSLITQTTTAYFSEWPAVGFELPGSPLASVSSIKYTDTDATQTTVTGTVYDVDTSATVGTVKLAEGQSWPSTSLRRNQPIEVIYVSGLDADGTLTPQPIKQAMLLHIGHMYENREQAVVGTIATELPFAFEALVAPYVVATL